MLPSIHIEVILLELELLHRHPPERGVFLKKWLSTTNITVSSIVNFLRTIV